MMPSILAVAAAVLFAVPAHADPLPPRGQALMVLRVLAFDKGLERRASGAVLVAVAARAGEVAGVGRRDAVVAAIRELSKDSRTRGLSVEARAVSWDGGSAESLSRAAAVVVVGKLAEQAAEVGQVTRARRVLSIGEDAASVERGLAVAVFARDSRPVIAASMLAARQEGVTFEPSFLRQAELLEFAGQ